MERLGGQHSVAAAQGPLRDVLLADANCGIGWIVRGRCFARMGAPLLAGLHFEKACGCGGVPVPSVLEEEGGVDLTAPFAIVYPALVAAMATCCKPQRLVRLARAASTVLAAVPDLAAAYVSLVGAAIPTSGVTPPGGVPAPATPPAALAWDHAQLLKAQGDALFHEGYYAAAVGKYKAATACADACGVAPATDAAVYKLYFACHVNAAASWWKKGGDTGEGVKLCEEALRLAQARGEAGTRRPDLSP